MANATADSPFSKGCHVFANQSWSYAMQIITKRQAISLGLKRYFTGKPCKQGHVTERYVTKSSCVECLKESRLKRIDKIRAKQREAYRAMSPEARDKERERLRKHRRKKYWSNPEKYRAEAREHQKKNQYSHAQRLAAWHANNPNARYEYNQRPDVKLGNKIRANRRRAIKKQAIPKWANTDAIEQIYATCPKGWHVDHIVPLVSKLVCGLHCEANLRHLPARENMSKNNHHWPDMP
jgi:hypothetical protein